MTNQSKAAFKAEEQRQADILSTAIKNAIAETGQQFDRPILNAVFGALVANIAGALAAVPDSEHRKQIRKAMDKTLPIALSLALSRPHPHAQTIIIGGVRQ